MNDHVQPDIAACLHRCWPIQLEDDLLGKEAAQRAQALERRMLAHPDPRDPDHPGEEE